jgi:hypothetical protein
LSYTLILRRPLVPFESTGTFLEELKERESP